MSPTPRAAAPVLLAAAAAPAYAERARALGEQLDEPAVMIRAQIFAALAQVLSGGPGWEDLEDAWHTAMVEPAMAEHAGIAGAMICIGAAQHHDGLRAERCSAETDTHCREHDRDLLRVRARAAAALCMLHRGDWSLAATEADDILAWRGLIPMFRIMPLVTLGLIRARRGDGEVWPPLDEALDYGEPTDIVRLGIVWAARAEAAWLAGDNTAAISEAERGLKAATVGSGPWLVGALLRWIYLAGGQPPPLPAAEPYALELAGDWRAAANAWIELGCPYEAALAQLGGDDPHATRTALTTFDTLGARAAAERAGARLRQTGHRPMPYRRLTGIRVNPYGLTPREIEVLALLRKGLTDTEIATDLSISPKTAGHHVGAILTKLDVRTRRHAAAKFDERLRA